MGLGASDLITIARSPRGQLGGSARGGRFDRIRLSSLRVSCAWYGGAPQSISYSVAPSAHRSDCGSTSDRVSLSGEQYPGLPKLCLVASPPRSVFAIPKSSSRTVSFGPRCTFDGLTSLCTTAV